MRGMARFVLLGSLLAVGGNFATTIASVHLMVVEQVFPGAPGQPGTQYVMLRMTNSSQILTTNTYLRVENADGILLGRFGTFKANQANSGVGCTGYPNCPAILIGTSEAQNLYGFSFDQVVDGQTDGGAPPVPLPPEGGRICFVNSTGTTVYDCVAWGDFDCRRSGNCAQQNSQRTGDSSGNLCDLNFDQPAPSLQLGFALDRTQFNCASKNNSLDFQNVFPTPVANNGANANLDSDLDGLIDILDCGDLDVTSLYFPEETRDLRITDPGTGGTALTWASQITLTGSSTVFDILSGNLSDLLLFRDFADSTCLVMGHSTNQFTDNSPDPFLGEGRYYLVRTRNNCGRGTFGNGDLLPDPRDFLDNPTNGPCH